MMHKDEDVLKMSKLLAEKVIKHHNRCKNQEYTDEAMKCYELEDLAYMARLITADLSDLDKAGLQQKPLSTDNTL